MINFIIIKYKSVNKTDILISLVAIKNIENKIKYLKIEYLWNIWSKFFGRSNAKYFPPIFVNNIIEPLKRLLLAILFNKLLIILKNKKN